MCRHCSNLDTSAGHGKGAFVLNTRAKKLLSFVNHGRNMLIDDVDLGEKIVSSQVVWRKDCLKAANGSIIKADCGV